MYNLLKDGKPIQVRQEVLEFAIQMERKLQEHDETKGEKGWKEESCDFCFLTRKFSEETAELLREVITFKYRPASVQAKDLYQILGEAADVGNICMMISDKAKSYVRDFVIEGKEHIDG